MTHETDDRPVEEFEKAVGDAIAQNESPAQHLARLYEKFSDQVLARAASDLAFLKELSGMADVIGQRSDRLSKIMALQVEDLTRANNKPTPSPAAVAAKFAPVDRNGEIEQDDQAATLAALKLEDAGAGAIDYAWSDTDKRAGQ